MRHISSLYPNSMKNIETIGKGTHVSIIMRTLNRPILLVRALSSVLSQVHQDWHLYLVNDGGDRDVLEILVNDYRPAFGDRLTVIHHEQSKGMEAASNAALEKAVGDFIVVHDDDDAWHPDFLQQTTVFLNDEKNNNYAGVITGCDLITEQIDDDVVREIRRKKFLIPQYISFSSVLVHNVSPPIGFLIRKSATDAVGNFNEKMPVLGDWDYILRILQVGDIGVVGEVLAYYYHREVLNENNVYANTVIAGVDKHMLWNVRYTNALVRSYLLQNPEALGLMRLMAIYGSGSENDLIIKELEKLNERIKYSGFIGGIRKFFKKKKKYTTRDNN